MPGRRFAARARSGIGVLRRFCRERSPHARRILSLLLIILMIESVVALVDPFRMEEALIARAEVVLQRVSAPFYGYFQPTAGQQRVTVVLIDDAFVRTLSKDPEAKPVWPLPVNTLIALIRQIVSAKPAALFVDLAFPEAPREIRNGNSNSRQEAVEALSNGFRRLDPDVPVFLSDVIDPARAEPAYPERCPRYLATEDLGRASILAPGLVDGLFRGPGRTSNIEVVDSVVRGSNGEYLLAPLATGAAGSCLAMPDPTAGLGPVKDAPGLIASPALALVNAYQVYANRHRPDCAPPGSPPCLPDATLAFLSDIHRLEPVAPTASAVDPHGLARYYYKARSSLDHAGKQDRLALRWGARLTPGIREFFRNAANKDRCIDQFSGSRSPWKAYPVQVFGHVETALKFDEAQPCSYIDTISAVDARGAAPPEATCEGRSPPVSCFLTGRIVLLGASVPQVQDHVESPVSGETEGVYFHAVAVENLLTMGAKFRHARPRHWERILLFLLLVPLVAAMERLWHGCCRWLSPIRPPVGEFLLAPLCYLGVMLPMAVALIVLLFYSTDLPLAQIAMPMLALHTVLFGGLIERMRRRLNMWLGLEETEHRPVPAMPTTDHATDVGRTGPASGVAE